METVAVVVLVILCAVGLFLLAMTVGISIVKILRIIEDPEAFRQFKHKEECSSGKRLDSADLFTTLRYQALFYCSILVIILILTFNLFNNLCLLI